MITVDLRPGKQSRPNFLLSTSLLYKILPTNLGVCKPTCLYFLCIKSEVKQYYLSYRPRTECSISQFFETNCTQSIFRTINHGLLAKTFTVKKFPKSPIRPAGSHIWRAPNLQWTYIKFLFDIIKNLLRLLFFFYLMVLYLEKHLIRPAFWILLHAMSMNDCKQTRQRFKLQERLLTINKRNIIRWNIYRDKNFHSRRQVLKRL